MNRRIYKKLSKKAAALMPGYDWYLGDGSTNGKFALCFPKRERSKTLLPVEPHNCYISYETYMYDYPWTYEGGTEWDSTEALELLVRIIHDHFTILDPDLTKGILYIGPKNLSYARAVGWARKHGVPR